MSDAGLFDLTGKVALVTGGSRGLGREMVRAFALAGADVIIASRKLDACEELAAEIRSSAGRRALAVACHVGEWEQVERLAEAAYAEFGAISFRRIDGQGGSLMGSRRVVVPVFGAYVLADAV